MRFGGWSAHTADCRLLLNAWLVSRSRPSPNYSVFLARLPFLIAFFQFVRCESDFLHYPVQGLAVCHFVCGCDLLVASASTWVRAKTGFTFISPARLRLLGGQGQLAPAHSQGRSQEFDLFLPVPSSLGVLVCRGLSSCTSWPPAVSFREP